MPPSSLAPSLFFHLLAAVVWLGGLFLLTLLVWPETRRALANDPARYRLSGNLRRRFQPLVWLSMAVLIVTGLYQMSADPHYEGVLHFGSSWSRAILLKHLALGGMILCGALMQFRVAPRLERLGWLLERGQGDAHEWARWQAAERRLARIHLLLGMLTLACSAWATAL